MPEVIVYLAQGRSPEQKKALLRGISDTVVGTLGVDPEIVTVQIVESPKADKMKGGLTFEERAARP